MVKNFTLLYVMQQMNGKKNTEIISNHNFNRFFSKRKPPKFSVAFLIF
jgi:ABC-type sugar transport system permease subunit